MPVMRHPCDPCLFARALLLPMHCCCQGSGINGILCSCMQPCKHYLQLSRCDQDHTGRGGSGASCPFNGMVPSVPGRLKRS